MKYFVIFLGISLVVLFVMPDAFGLWIPLSPEELIEKSKTIFVGTITEINPVDVEYQSQISRNGTIKEKVGPEIMTLEEYTVDVEEFLKNPQDSDTIQVLRATVSGVRSGPSKISGFDIGDRVLFYLPKEEKQTHFQGQYLPESFEIPPQCDAKTVLAQPKIEGRNSFDIFQNGVAVKNNFTAGIPMNFVYSRDMDTLYGGGLDVVVSLGKEASNQPDFEAKIHTELEPCQWITSAKWDFTPEQGDYRMYLNIRETGDSGGDTSYTGFSVISDPKIILSPLKQFKSGISLGKIQCRDSLILVTKYNGAPACIKSESHKKLYERGWTKMVPIIPEIGKTGKYSLEIEGSSKIDIKYSIEGAVILSMKARAETESILIYLDAPYSGSLTISIPRQIADAKGVNGMDDIPFFVLVEGEEVSTEEISSTSDTRTITIPFEKRTKEIEIIGADYV